MSAKMRREALALRLNHWIAQEMWEGRLTQARSARGEPVHIVYTLCEQRVSWAVLEARSEQRVEAALDLPHLPDLRAGKEVSVRAWLLVAERIGKEGSLPTLPEVLATRRAYWAACDAAHQRRRDAEQAAPSPPHPKTPEAVSAPVSRVARLVPGEVSEVIVQSHLDAYRAEMDRPRAQGEPLDWLARELGCARQDFEVWRWRKKQERAARVAAWLDEAPPWGEEADRGRR